MKLRSLAVVMGMMAAAVAAHAQVGIYLAPTGAHITVSQADSGPFSFLSQNATGEWFKGATFGGYYDVKRPGPFHFGVDLRGRILGSPEGARANSFLIGPRIVFNVPLIARLHPYAEALVGFTASHSGLNPLNLKRAEYGGLVGADYRLGKHADWRALEIGFTDFTPMSSANFQLNVPTPTAHVVMLSSGIVVHF